jgi:hypothetical protein
LTWIFFFTPVAISSSESLRRTRRSWPRRGPAEPWPPPNRSSKPAPPPPKSRMNARKRVRQVEAVEARAAARRARRLVAEAVVARRRSGP